MRTTTKSAASSVVIMTSLILLILQPASSERHSLFWNPSITPQLLGEGMVKVVRIGDFLDIMCPHTGLTGTIKPNSTPIFDIYNVTQDEFNQCRVQGKSRLFFRCDRPDQENKLTLKMQTFSPSPFGFKFSYCHDYYYIAMPRGGELDAGSCGPETTRFKLSVACREPKVTTTTTAKPPPTPAKTQSTETTTTTTTPLVIDRLPVESFDNFDDDVSSEADDAKASRKHVGGAGAGRRRHPKFGGRQLGADDLDVEEEDEKLDVETRQEEEPDQQAAYGKQRDGNDDKSSSARATSSLLAVTSLFVVVVLMAT